MGATASQPEQTEFNTFYEWAVYTFDTTVLVAVSIAGGLVSMAITAAFLELSKYISSPVVLNF